MENGWAAEHLQVIRTLMERSAIYRRALAPIMLTVGLLGGAGGVIGPALGLNDPRAFAVFWMGLSVVALSVTYLLARRQALQASEAFWSPPTRRVTQALLPALFAGMVAGLLAAFFGEASPLPASFLPPLWMMFYGASLHSAGFFMQRGIKLFGWLFLLCGGACAALHGILPPNAAAGHVVMGLVFGGLHLAYGLYLYFTESK